MNLVELETCGVCFGEYSREPDGFCYSSIEKNPTSEKMVFSSPSLCSFCDWRNIASAEIFISILSWGEKNPLVLWHQNLNWILKYLFLSPFFVSWWYIEKEKMKMDLENRSQFLDKIKTFSFPAHWAKILKNLITQIALPNPQFTEYQTEFTNCVSVPIFKCNCEKSRFTPPLPFSSIYKLINKEALF